MGQISTHISLLCNIAGEDFEALIRNEDSRKISNIEKETLDNPGYYCIRLRKNSKISDRY